MKRILNLLFILIVISSCVACDQTGPVTDPELDIAIIKDSIQNVPLETFTMQTNYISELTVRVKANNPDNVTLTFDSSDYTILNPDEAVDMIIPRQKNGYLYYPIFILTDQPGKVIFSVSYEVKSWSGNHWDSYDMELIIYEPQFE